VQRVSADEAVKLIRSNDTIVIGGSAVAMRCGSADGRAGTPLPQRGQPRNITACIPVGLGDGATLGGQSLRP